MVTPTQNPLAAYMRQPKIFIRLPSGGQYWPDGSLEKTETGEYPVYSMTAKDEMLLKIPDALMNGQAVVDVIQNCVPNIKNAWKTPSIDVDVILIAIRLATYGELLSTPVNLGSDKEGDDIEFEYQIDLRILLDTLNSTISWDPFIQVSDEITIFVKPVDYKHISDVAIQSFETQKIIQIANDESIKDEDKLEIFKDSFSKLTKVTIGTVINSIYKIDSANGSTDNPQHIADYINNIDKETFNKIQNHLETLKNQNAVKPIVIETPQELKDRGYSSNTIEIPIVFDVSTFFV